MSNIEEVLDLLHKTKKTKHGSFFKELLHEDLQDSGDDDIFHQDSYSDRSDIYRDGSGYNS